MLPNVFSTYSCMDMNDSSHLLPYSPLLYVPNSINLQQFCVFNSPIDSIQLTTRYKEDKCNEWCLDKQSKKYARMLEASDSLALPWKRYAKLACMDIES